MKRLFSLIAVLTVAAMLIGAVPSGATHREYTAEQVIELLSSIDSLQDMQDKRAEFKVSGNYDEANADSVAEHQDAHFGYGEYVSRMLELREEAKVAYDSLSDEDKLLIEAELLEKLTASIEVPLNTALPESSIPNITAGNNGYNYRVVFPKNRAYEISTHFNSVGGFPMTVVMVDSDKISGSWLPKEEYSFGNSEYEVLYCCEQLQGVVDGTYYKRVNLEDADYYSREAAAHIRSIVNHSYPYISLEEMKAELAANGFKGAEELSVCDVIAAVQFAIWTYSNESYGYNEEMSSYYATIDPDKLSFASAFHSVSQQTTDYYPDNTRYRTYSEDIDERISKLTDYLINLKEEPVSKSNMLISEVNILDNEPVQKQEGLYNLAVQIKLNSSGTSESDKIKMHVCTKDSYGNVTESIEAKVEFGIEEYDYVIRGKLGDTVYVTIEGEQTVPMGAYLYVPEGGKEQSQVLVGVAGGKTKVRAVSKASFDVPNEGSLSLNVTKLNADGQSLSGTELTLYYVNESKKQEIASYTTDEEGRLLIDGLLPGVKYELVETKAPAGYVLKSEPISFEIICGEIPTFSWTALPEGSEADSSGGLTIVNSPSPAKAQLEGYKYMDGKGKEGFEIILANAETKEPLKTATSDENGRFSFELDFETAGVYTYMVYEAMGNDPYIDYDDSVYTVTFTVSDSDGQGLKAIALYEKGELIFENRSVTDIRVIKQWENKESSALKLPEQVNIILYADGIKLREQRISAEDGWEYTFTGLEMYKDGKLIEYTVCEEATEGYVSLVKGNAKEGFVIINTPSEPPEESPQTSDQSLVCAATAVISFAGLALAVIYRRRYILKRK